jgi:hypothetical protein
VLLNAYYKGQHIDRASLTIRVTQTILEVEVIEYYSGYVIPEASIILYPSLADWDYEENPIVEDLRHVRETGIQ